MDMTKFRPADTSATAIRAALTKAQAEQQQMQEAIAGHKAKRDSLLLDGDAKQLAAAEQGLKTSRDMVERIDAIVGELATRLSAAEQHEAVQRVADAAQEFAAADASLAKWWRAAGPKIRTMLLEGHALHTQRSDAAYSHMVSMKALEQRYAGQDVSAPHLSAAQDGNVDDRATIVAAWAEGQSYEGDVR